MSYMNRIWKLSSEGKLYKEVHNINTLIDDLHSSFLGELLILVAPYPFPKVDPSPPAGSS